MHHVGSVYLGTADLPSGLASALSKLRSSNIHFQQGAKAVQCSGHAAETATEHVAGSDVEPQCLSALLPTTQQRGIDGVAMRQDSRTCLGLHQVSRQLSKDIQQEGDQLPGMDMLSDAGGQPSKTDWQWGRKRKRQHRPAPPSGAGALNTMMNSEAVQHGKDGRNKLSAQKQRRQRQVLASLPANQLVAAQPSGMYCCTNCKPGHQLMHTKLTAMCECCVDAMCGISESAPYVKV